AAALWTLLRSTGNERADCECGAGERAEHRVSNAGQVCPIDMRTRVSLMITFVASLGVTAAFAQQAATHADFVPSEELNKQFPRWLRFSAEFRTRLEGFTGGGFRAANADDYLLTRLRINMHIQPAHWLKFEFQGQDARVFGKNQRPAAPPFQDTLDVRLAYVQVGDPEHKTF